MLRSSPALFAALALAAVSNAARADGAAAPAPGAPAAAPAPAETAGATAPFIVDRFGWAGLGLYNVGVSACAGGFCASASTTNFGLTAGGAYGLLQLAPGLKLNGWADLAVILASGGSYFPLTAGAGVTYDKLPVALFGGLGLQLAIPSSGSTSVGVDFKAMGLYPLAMVMPHLGAEVQFNLALLSNSLTIWNLTVGAAYSF